MSTDQPNGKRNQSDILEYLKKIKPQAKTFNTNKKGRKSIRDLTQEVKKKKNFETNLWRAEAKN